MSDEKRVIELGIAGLTDATEVGRGGFATVYRARQAMLDRTVAVKVIHGTVVDPLGGERFLREVKAAGRLSQHPNVAPVYDVGTTSANQPYLIMPYYSNGSLARMIEGGRALEEKQAVRIGTTLANTLAYVHGHGVLHRDVKPANVLMSDSDEPLLCDFGVARLTDSSLTTMHTTGTSVVTWAYGPPEAFTGGDPTPAWDIYSLGATMYALLTGAPPFVEGRDVNVFTVLNRIGNVDVPDLRERGISPMVADAVRQAMAKAPADRPTTATEFAELLARRTTGALPRVDASMPPPSAPPADGTEAIAPPAAPLEPPVAPAAPFEPPVAPLPLVEPLSPPVVEPLAPVAVPLPPSPPVEPIAAAAEPKAPATRAPATWLVPLVIAVAGAVLTLVSESKPLFKFSSTTAYSGPLWNDLQVSLPPLVLMVGVVFVTRAAVAAEWVIGAGLGLLAFDYARMTEFLFRQTGGSGVDVTGFAVRTIGATLVLVAVVLAWRRGMQPDPARRPWVAVVVTVAGGLLALKGIDATQTHWSDWNGSSKEWVVVGASAAALVVIVVRLVARRKETSAAAALVGLGVSGTLYWIAEYGIIGDLRGGNYQSDGIIAAFGFAVIGVLGALLWAGKRVTLGAAPRR